MTDKTMVETFKDDYKFLSNFQVLPTPMRMRYGLIFNTVEHWYVANKSKSIEWQSSVAKHPLKGLKRYGRSVALREDWDEIKISVMAYGLTHKFDNKKNPCLRRKLQDTGKCFIQEGNWRGDTFWGVCLKTGKGSNVLGKLLMELRDNNNFHYMNYYSKREI